MTVINKLIKTTTMKKHIIYFLMLLPAVFIASGCQKYETGNPPASTVANFTFSTSNSGKAPCVVTFTNTSLNAAGYLWDFGNGQTSTEANPTATYNTPGFYTVKLTCTAVNDVYYNQLVKTAVINVRDPNAGLAQVLYYTTCATAGGAVHMVVLNDDGIAHVQDFATVTLVKPYGITTDTSNKKVYVSDYSVNAIYRFDADGTNPLKILDGTIFPALDSPEGIMVAGDKLYWGQPGGIYRSNLDGTSPELYKSTIDYPADMHYDPVGNKIYAVVDMEDGTGGYFSMNFDGSNLVNHIPGVDGLAIEVNVATGKAYFAGYAVAGTAMPDNGIYTSNIDGTQVQKIGEYGLKATWGVAIDDKRGKLFWSFKNSNYAPDGKIIRANLDGSGKEDWITGINPQAMQAVWIKL